MKNKKFYDRLVAKMYEVSSVPPQTLGPFTPLYKKIVPQFKFFPLKTLLPLSLVATLMAYFVFGTALISLASLLQLSF